MKVLTPICCLLLSISSTAVADEPISYAQGMRLMARYQCRSCHAAYTTLHGPSLSAIARKYASDPTAVGNLETKVLNGSSGVWGTESAMPSNIVPAGDLHTLVEWILSFRQVE